MNQQHQIAIIGLGYVGLPLARLFATKYPVVGFDINQKRISELNNGIDSTLEVENNVLQNVLVKQNPFNSHSELVEGSQMDTERSRSAGLFCSSNTEDISQYLPEVLFSSSSSVFLFISLPSYIGLPSYEDSSSSSYTSSV